MKVKWCLIFSFLILLSAHTVHAEKLVWTEDFLNVKMRPGWKFRDIRTFSSVWGVKGDVLAACVQYGAFYITSYESFPRHYPDRPIIEREPPPHGDDITVYGIFSSPDPINVWMGLFLLGHSDKEFSAVVFGGNAGFVADGLDVKTVSSIPIWDHPFKKPRGEYAGRINYFRHGLADSGFHEKIELKIVKEGDRLSGYYRPYRWRDEEDWNFIRRDSIHGTLWTHDFEVTRVGVGFLNNSSNRLMSLIVHSLSIEYEPADPTPERLPQTLKWCDLKAD